MARPLSVSLYSYLLGRSWYATLRMTSYVTRWFSRVVSTLREISRFLWKSSNRRTPKNSSCKTANVHFSEKSLAFRPRRKVGLALRRLIQLPYCQSLALVGWGNFYRIFVRQNSPCFKPAYSDKPCNRGVSYRRARRSLDGVPPHVEAGRPLFQLEADNVRSCAGLFETNLTHLIFPATRQGASGIAFGPGSIRSSRGALTSWRLQSVSWLGN